MANTSNRIGGSSQEPANRYVPGAVQGAHRPSDDRLLLLDEVAELTRRPEATLRYLRHLGGDAAPPLWRQGRRLVAWRSDVVAWLDVQRTRDNA